MSWWEKFTTWFKARLHVRPTELKGTPGVKDAAVAATGLNGLVGAKVDQISPSAEHAVIQLLPAELAGLAGIDDHVIATPLVNALLAAKHPDPVAGS